MQEALAPAPMRARLVSSSLSRRVRSRTPTTLPSTKTFRMESRAAQARTADTSAPCRLPASGMSSSMRTARPVRTGPSIPTTCQFAHSAWRLHRAMIIAQAARMVRSSMKAVSASNRSTICAKTSKPPCSASWRSKSHLRDHCVCERSSLNL